MPFICSIHLHSADPHPYNPLTAVEVTGPASANHSAQQAPFSPSLFEMHLLCISTAFTSRHTATCVVIAVGVIQRFRKKKTAGHNSIALVMMFKVFGAGVLEGVGGSATLPLIVKVGAGVSNNIRHNPIRMFYMPPSLSTLL